MSFLCFQALLLPPNFLITTLASAVVWQTSTSTWRLQTTWLEVTAVCYRSFLVSSAAPWSEGRSSAPRTAARAKPRHRTRRGEFFLLQLDPRRQAPPNLKHWKATVHAGLVIYEAKHSRHQEAKEPKSRCSLRRPHKRKKRKVPPAESFMLPVKGMKLPTFSTTCGGLGRADENLYLP